MKKFASFILAAALGMALLTGCGSEKPAETSAADPQSPRPLRLLLTQRLLSLKPVKKKPLRPQQQKKNPPAAAGTAQ